MSDNAALEKLGDLPHDSTWAICHERLSHMRQTVVDRAGTVVLTIIHHYC